MSANKKSAYLALILSMVIFGTIGICRRQLPLPSETLAFVRGILGSVFLLLVMRVTGKKFDRSSLRGSLILLILTGAMIGFNWILLFEAYNYTTVALFSYIDPVTAVLLSALFLHETMTPMGMIGSVMIIGALLFLR